MLSSVAKFVTRAALLALPLCASAQLHPGVPDRTGNLTLLPGPTITSPAGKHTLTPGGWIISSGTLQGGGTISSGAPGSGAQPTFTFVQGAVPPAERVAELELRAAQDKLEQAQQKLAKLQAERAAAQARRLELGEQRRKAIGEPSLQFGPGQLRLSDPLRFDAKLSPAPTPTKLEGPWQRTEGELKFKRD
jgi:hypothetical protein